MQGDQHTWVVAAVCLPGRRILVKDCKSMNFNFSLIMQIGRVFIMKVANVIVTSKHENLC